MFDTEDIHANGVSTKSVESDSKFETLCRKPGTRINAMFTALEEGVSFRSIATAFSTDVGTVKLYATVLEKIGGIKVKWPEDDEDDGDLGDEETPLEVWKGNEPKKPPIEEKQKPAEEEELTPVQKMQKRVQKMREIGMPISRIARTLGISRIEVERIQLIGLTVAKNTGKDENGPNELFAKANMEVIKKEKNVGNLLKKGMSVSRIARRLKMSRTEVEFYVGRIRGK